MGQSSEVDRFYKEGVAALRAGDKETARERLMEVLHLDRTHEQAWLWLSAAIEEDEDRRVCLENVLTINPNNEAARRGMEKLNEKMGMPPEPAFAPLPPRPEPAQPSMPLMEHSSSPVAETLDAAAGRTVEPRKKKADPDDVWRTSLYVADDGVEPENVGKFVRAGDRPKPKLEFWDLINAWGNLLIFKANGVVDDEINYGGFVHTSINLVAGGILQMISVLILLLMFSTLARGGAQLPLIRSISEQIPPDVAEQIGLMELQSSDFDPLGDLRGGGIAALGGFGLVLLAVMVLSIPALFVGTMFEAFFTDFVSNWLQGKGDLINTWSALSLVIVVQQFAQIPVILITPFLPFGIVLVIWGAYGLYQLLLKALAVGRAQKFNVLIGIGALVISGFMMNVALGILSFVLSILSAIGGA